MMHNWLEPVSQRILFGRGDATDPRLGEIVKPLTNLEEATAGDVCLIGYPDDEGIKLNGGRVGAREAPDTIRRCLYRMTPSLGRPKTARCLWDAGNLRCDAELRERHDRARQVVRAILSGGSRLATLGGGHDYGYSDMAGFCEHALETGKRPFVVNFDAHLDVRPDDKSEHSGTPFFRLLEGFKGRLDFFEVGIQDWCNSSEHRSWAEKRGAKVISLEDWLMRGTPFSEFLNEKVFRFFSSNHSLAVSVDMDCFSSSVVPGASQVFPVGLDAVEFLKSWRRTLDQFRPKLTSFYEVSPPLDQDDRSSKLAAILVHQFLYSG